MRWSQIILFFKKPPVIIKLILMIFATTYYGASGFLYFEQVNRPTITLIDGIWWAVVTMTTVGYGDIFPETFNGRFLIAYPIMTIGTGLTAYTFTSLASFLISIEDLSRKGFLMKKTKEHIVICNYSSFKRFNKILNELRSEPFFRDKPIILIDDTLDMLPQVLPNTHVAFVRGNPSKIEILKRAYVNEATHAVVLSKDPTLPHSDAQTVTTCLALKQEQPNIHIVAECIDAENENILELSGCDSVVCISALAPGILAQELSDPGITKVLGELMIWKENSNNLLTVPLKLTGRNKVEDIRIWARKHNVIFLGVRSSDGVVLNPQGEYILDKGDLAIIISPMRYKNIAI